MNSFQGRVIAVTGAASGIGLATAKHLHTNGASLSLADINTDALNKAKSELESDTGKGRVMVYHLDVRKSHEVDEWIKSTVQILGKIDGAANLAGVLPKPCNMADLSDETWDFVMAINCKGTFNCLRAQIGAMIKQGRGGSIVNASSAAGIKGVPGQSVYSATKSAVISMTKSAAVEGGSSMIRVNAIAPGPIDTPLLKTLEANNGREVDASNLPLPRIGSPDEVAKLIAFLLSDDSSYQTGTVVPIDGGYLA